MPSKPSAGLTVTCTHNEQRRWSRKRNEASSRNFFQPRHRPTSPLHCRKQRSGTIALPREREAEREQGEELAADRRRRLAISPPTLEKEKPPSGFHCCCWGTRCHVLATLLQNQELLDDLSTKESRNLLALAQGIRATPWPIEESDDEVNEADLQAALEASKKADNVVPFSSSSTVSLPVSFSPSLVSSLPSAVVCSNMPSSSTLIDKRLFLNSHFDDCSALKSVAVSHEESVPSNLPCVSVDFADVRARVLSTQSILTSLKSTVVRMEKVLLDDKKLLQSFEAGDVGSDSAPAR
nr:hypothetical protein Iba_chr09bCG11670 [Ipomoea batatas]